MSQYPFIHYLIDIIGTIGLFILFPGYCAWLLFSLAKKERSKLPVIEFKSEEYAREPFIEDFEKGFSDGNFEDFKIKKSLEYSSN